MLLFPHPSPASPSVASPTPAAMDRAALLAGLRARIARFDPGLETARATLPLAPELDAHLPWSGLPLAGLHEVLAAEPEKPSVEGSVAAWFQSRSWDRESPFVFGGGGEVAASLPIADFRPALSFLVGGGKLSDTFDFELYEGAAMNFAGGLVLVGTPKTPSPAYQKVLFYIDGPTSQVRRVLIVDGQGNRNRFDFENPKVNETIPADRFKFVPPPGTSVVRP